MFDVGIAEAVADLPKASVVVAAAVVVAIAVVEDIAVAEDIVAAETVVAVGIAFVVFDYAGPSSEAHFEKLDGS